MSNQSEVQGSSGRNESMKTEFEDLKDKRGLKRGKGKGKGKKKIVVTLISPRKRGDRVIPLKYPAPPSPSGNLTFRSTFFENLRNMRVHIHRDGIDTVKLDKGIQELATMGVFPPVEYLRGMKQDDETLKVSHF